ncbi:MAG: Gfo/Idh/MocA family oxidoreductase [Armatimonadetes bacterium]|nr:Gfo/Idh/MocA family oxidoreductase [Armatimonadota bacterium]
MPEGDRVKVAVIGVGIGHAHLNGYSKCKDAEIAAVCDVDEARAHKVASEFGVKEIYTDYHELLRRDDIQGISVCLPNFLHAPIAIDCFNAKKAVLCEKPLATTVAEGERMVQAAKENGCLFMMGFNNRFRGDTQVLKKFIEAGELGDIYYAKTGWLRRAGIPGMGGWFTTKEKSGGGPLIDLGVHVLDMTLYLMGNPKPVSAMGSAYAKFGPGRAEAMGKVYDVEDLASGFVKFDNGATVFVEASWESFTERERIYSELFGTKGGATLDPFRIFKREQGVLVDLTPEYPRVSGHERETWHFVECIREKKTPLATGEHGLDILKILDAIYRSAETGDEVKIS